MDPVLHTYISTGGVGCRGVTEEEVRGSGGEGVGVGMDLLGDGAGRETVYLTPH